MLTTRAVPRLVPRRGAGPELRSSGREIDEYLMRLLHAGAVDASQDVVFHTLVSSCMPCHVSVVCRSCALDQGVGIYRDRRSTVLLSGIENRWCAS